MRVSVAFLYRYLSPFLAGVCVAVATVVESIPLIVVLLLAAVLFGFASLPAGGRMIGRIIGGSS